MKQKGLTRLLAAITMLFFMGITAVLAQGQIQLSLQTRNPMPERLSEWQRNPSLIQLRVTNPSGNPEYRGVRVSFEVRDMRTHKVVIRSKDGNPRIPTIDIAQGGWTGQFFGRNLIDANAVEIDPSIRSGALATNSLPEGSYSFCIRLLNSQGQALLTTGGCSNLTILHPKPPTLILPNQYEVFLPNDLPNFRWAPAQRVNGTYQLRIVPIYQYQSEQTAIQLNPAILDKNVGGSLSYQYLASDPSFLNYFGIAYGFAWQVSITDPRTGRTYRSTIRRFTFGSNNPLIGMQNVKTGHWPIPLNRGGGKKGGKKKGKKGGKKGGKGGGNKNNKNKKNLGNIGTVKSTCDKARSFRIWMNFGNMGFNTFPMDVLGISGVDPTVADISYDASGKITVKCKSTGTFTITVKIRAMRLGLAPFTDVYTARITITCDCGKKKKNKKKKNNGGQGGDKDDSDDGDDSDDDDGNDDDSDNDEDKDDDSDDSDDEANDDDPCKRLKELEKKIADAEKKLKEAEEAAQQASHNAANAADAKKKAEDAAKKAKEELDKVNKEVDDLKRRRNQLLKDMKETHANEGQNFGWVISESTGEMTYGVIINGKLIEGIVPNAMNQARELEKLNKQLKKKLAEQKKKKEEAEQKQKEAEETEKKLQEEKKKKLKEVEDAAKELEELRKEYEELKKECDKKKDSSDDTDSGDDDGSDDDERDPSNGEDSDNSDNGGVSGGDNSDGTDSGKNGGQDGSEQGDVDSDPCDKLKEVEQKIQDTQRELDQLQDKAVGISELEDIRDALRDAIEETNRELARLKDIWLRLSDMTTEARNEHGEGSEEFQNLDRNRQNYLEQIQSLERQLSGLREQLRDIEEELDEKRQARDNANVVQDELDRLRAEQNRLKDECDKKNEGNPNNDDRNSGDNSTFEYDGSDRVVRGDGNETDENDSKVEYDGLDRVLEEDSDSQDGTEEGSRLDRGTNESDSIFEYDALDRRVRESSDSQGETTSGFRYDGLSRANNEENNNVDAACGVDCSKIVASRGTGATGGMIIVGRAGSVPPNSTVTITDENGNTVSVTADEDGSFRAVESDLPDGFDHTVGGELTVTVDGKDCTVIIQR